MGSVSKKQLYIIIGTFSIIVLLYFAPKRPVGKEKELSAEAIEKAEALTVVRLTAEKQKELEALNVEVMNAKTPADKEKSLSAIITFWKVNKQPLQAAYTSRKLAELKNTATDWMISGDWFYKTTKFVEENQRNEIYQQAISCYEKALQLEPDNNKVKVKLGVCYVESTTEPMKGVSLLKDVADKDPKN